MSTNSTIIIKEKETFKSIYCHWDGYPEHQLPILNGYYNTIEKAKELISLGNLSSLGERLNPNMAGHSFNNAEDGVCVAYGRDRGEDDQEADSDQNLEALRSEQYNYLFNEDTKTWEVI